MEFTELIQKRYSVRAYRPTPVQDEKLEAVLEAARLAPTASNRQSFQLIVIQTKGREEELRRIYDKDWFVQPPLVICACRFPMDPARERKDYTDLDNVAYDIQGLLALDREQRRFPAHDERDHRMREHHDVAQRHHR